MPYGFIKHIENNHYRLETIRSYEKILKQFFSYLSYEYQAIKEPYQISSSDIKNYLTSQHEKGKSLSTINKELAILKTFFHYLWEINKVSVDPAVKIKRYKVKPTRQIEVSYEQITDCLQKTLHNNRYSPLRKVIFLLAAKGLKTADFRFKKDDVTIDRKHTQVEILLSTRIIYLSGEEAECFIDYFEEIKSQQSEYVFVTKSQHDDALAPVQVMSILNHLRAVSFEYLPKKAQALTLISIRRALMHYLYAKKYPIQKIAQQLGIEERSVSNYLKNLTA